MQTKQLEGNKKLQELMAAADQKETDSHKSIPQILKERQLKLNKSSDSEEMN